MVIKILLSGGSGQLGTELQKHRSYLNPSHKEMDITDGIAVKDYLLKTTPSLIVHAAAYTQTTLPDRDPQAAFECFKVNVLGTRNIAKYAECPIIYVSSETVLEPYNFYAITKYQGELEIKAGMNAYTIIRTSFRFNPFEYPKAPSDMLTIGDYCEVIAKLIDKAIDISPSFQTIYIGTGIKTVYELAKQTRPDVERITRKDLLPFRLPAMTSLLNI